jgi:hypothetical protein
MKQIWDGTLTLEAYRDVLVSLKFDFPTNYLIAEIPQIVSQIHRPKILLRHYISGSLAKAWDMARLEHELGYRASYMIRDDSPDLDLGAQDTVERLQRIRGLGHEIGICLALPEARPALEELEARVEEAGARLSDLLGFPVFSVSFTGPIPAVPHESQFVGSKVNASAPLMTRWALEDSQPRWELEPPLDADEDPARALLQVIVRPEIWGTAEL